MECLIIRWTSRFKSKNLISENEFSQMTHFAAVLKSVVEAKILHVVEFDGLQLLAVQQPVAEGHAADKLPAGHHPHHRVIAADLQVSCNRACSGHSHGGGGVKGRPAARTYWVP